MAQSRRYTFIVEGKGHFPFDMLRYDCCYPATSDDAAALRRVTLRATNGPPTRLRWQSFGWQVPLLQQVPSP